MRLVLGAAAMAATFGAPAAQAAPVELKTAITTGLAKADRVADFGGSSAPAGRNSFCTAEPKSIFYGTDVFNPANALKPVANRLPGDAQYVPANEPSASDLVPATQAGSRSDLCVGFTLTPNADPAIIRTSAKPSLPRIASSPAFPDVPQTRVADSSNRAVDGDDMRRIVVDLPAGYLATLKNIPECEADEQFGRFNWAPVACPAASRMGDAYVRVNTFIQRALRFHVLVPGNPIYNLSHNPDEIGMLGVMVQPVDGVAPVKFTIRLTFRPDGSGRIRAIVENAPKYTLDVDNVDGFGQPIDDSEAQHYPLYVESVGPAHLGIEGRTPVDARRLRRARHPLRHRRLGLHRRHHLRRRRELPHHARHALHRLRHARLPPLGGRVDHRADPGRADRREGGRQPRPERIRPWHRAPQGRRGPAARRPRARRPGRERRRRSAPLPRERVRLHRSGHPEQLQGRLGRRRRHHHLPAHLVPVRRQGVPRRAARDR
ncbi:MAG: hypothetical protein PGN13_08730 [Patulibacter minatonensis]